MVQISCQWCLLVIATVFLAVRPTLELFVGKTGEQPVERQSQGESDIDGDGEMEMYQEAASLPLPPLVQPPPPPQRSKKRRKRSSESMRDSIVFPDQVPNASQEKSDSLEDRIFVVPNTAGPPPCARGSTFCESVDEYPAEHVIKLLRKEPVFVRGFFQDERRKYSIADDDVQDRIDISDESPLCAAREHTVYPKMAKNIEGNWLFVINQDEYIQGVRVEKCLNDRECSFPASLPNGYRSQCKQKYIYRKLVALNGTGQGVISDSFQFPSCCSCVIKLDHTHNRFGGSSGGSGGAPLPLPLTLPKSTPTPLKNKKP
uniref:Spaetzle domain-containing protein n=1 Tax=Homalodisca liturata TaxID=320908 RepID=A0A1B6JNK1_9HEMI